MFSKYDPNAKPVRITKKEAMSIKDLNSRLASPTRSTVEVCGEWYETTSCGISTVFKFVQARKKEIKDNEDRKIMLDLE